MKYKLIFSLMLATLLASGLILVSCDDGGTEESRSSGILTFTDQLPPKIEFIDNFLKPEIRIIPNNAAVDYSTSIVAYLHQDVAADWNETAKTVRLRISKTGNTILFGVYSSGDNVWTASGKYDILVETEFMTPNKILRGVDFSNGNASIKWSDFVDVW